MYNWYGVLGIRSGASDEEIDAGFLRTATQLHPNRNATPDPRLRLVLQAYGTLRDPAKRSCYEAALASRYAQIRQARRSKAVTFATTCALTLCCALTAVLWREQGETLAIDLTPGREVLAANPQATTNGAAFAFAAPREQGLNGTPQSRFR